MFSPLDAVCGAYRPFTFAIPIATCMSRSLPVQLLASQKVSSVLPHSTHSLRPGLHAAVKEVRADISGHYEDRGLQIDVRQSGEIIVARYYGCSHTGILRNGVLTLPTLVDSHGTVLPSGHIKFAGGAQWIKCEKTLRTEQRPQEVNERGRGSLSSMAGGPQSDAFMVARRRPSYRPALPMHRFGSWIGTSSSGAPDCAPVAGIADVLWARESPATKACLAADRHVEAIRALGNALVQAAVEAIDEIDSRGCSPEISSLNSDSAAPMVDHAVRRLRPRALTVDSDTLASEKGFPASELSVDTPHCADRALMKSEALLQQMATLLDEEPFDRLGQDSQLKPSSQRRARSRTLSETCTPIAGRALQKSEKLLNEMFDLAMFSEEDGGDSFGSD